MSTTTASVSSPAAAPVVATLPRGAALTDGLTIARRNLLRILRTPQLVFFSTIQPIMFVLLFNYVFGGALVPRRRQVHRLPAARDHGADRRVRRDLHRDRPRHRHGHRHHRPVPVVADGPLRRPVRAYERGRRPQPLRRGPAWSSSARSSASGSTTAPLLAVASVLLAVLFGFALSWVFAFIGLKTGDAETAQLAGFAIIFPLVFASSAFVPTASMPGWLQAFADHQPVTADGERHPPPEPRRRHRPRPSRSRSCGSRRSSPCSRHSPWPATARAERPGALVVDAHID